MPTLKGTAGNDRLIGQNYQNTDFDIRQGGDDTVIGGGANANDRILAGSSYTNADHIDGGAGGYDQLVLNGDYSSGVTLGANVFDVEAVVMSGGHDYSLMITSEYVTQDGYLDFDGSGLNVDDSLTVDASAVVSQSISFFGGESADLLVGGALNDYFSLRMGGDDTAIGGAGNDTFSLATSAGRVTIHGGSGDDLAGLTSPYGPEDLYDLGRGYDTLSVADTFKRTLLLDANLKGVDEVRFNIGGGSFQLSDGMATPARHGFALTVSGRLVGTGLAVDASDESDARLDFEGGSANEWFHGGDMADRFDLSGGGDDTILGGGGDDQLIFGYNFDGAFDANDKVDGSADRDTLRVFIWNQTVTAKAETIRNIEQIVMGADGGLNLDDANLAGNRMLRLKTDSFASQGITFDGSAETSGRFDLNGGSGADQLTGGAGRDTLSGGWGDDTLGGGRGNDRIRAGEGADVIAGGSGADHFGFGAISESLAGAADRITDLADEDLIILSRIDADLTQRGDQAFEVIAAFSGHAGELLLSYSASSRTTTILLDVDGDAEADSSIVLVGQHTDFANFVL